VLRTRLQAGADAFVVEELPLYEFSGQGEHLFVHVEKKGLNSDDVARSLAKQCGVAFRAVSMAGRKDRHAIAQQWFSVHFGEETKLPSESLSIGEGWWRVLAVTRHRNKLKPGHLRGNRFRLRLIGVSANFADELHKQTAGGWPNLYGQQRFGLHGANMLAAQHWSHGRVKDAVAALVSPDGAWHPDAGADVPEGFVPGPAGKVVGALRRGSTAEEALQRAGQPLQRWVASVAQAAIANAIIVGRQEAGLLRTLRVGDIALGGGGQPFFVDAETAAVADARLAARDIFVSVPMPGTWKLRPSPTVEAE
jgi:tRNA(Glu) U13 pseudouridine synthase TruD